MNGSSFSLYDHAFREPRLPLTLCVEPTSRFSATLTVFKLTATDRSGWYEKQAWVSQDAKQGSARLVCESVRFCAECRAETLLHNLFGLLYYVRCKFDPESVKMANSQHSSKRLSRKED